MSNEYRARFPGRDAESLTDEDLLREVMNTVGKPGKLGENVKCVVSVSMLTEGWDANTVTHILGVRAFGTQLLCEQVVGRGLRRMSYVANDRGLFQPEYAEVYGVPFSFIPCSGSAKDPKPGPIPTRVRAREDRMACEITFPRVVGYRYDVPAERLQAHFSNDSMLTLSTADVPTRTENAPIVGEASIHTLDDLKHRREQEVVFLLAKLTLEKYFRADGEAKTERGAAHRFDPEVKSWLFPQLLTITRRWLDQCVTLKDNTFIQLLLLHELAHDAADRIYKAIVAADDGAKTLKPILRPYDVVGSTRYVDFDTTRPIYKTRPDKCHVSHVVADTDSWEQKLADSLEDMGEVVAYVKNDRLGFTVPYTLNGEEKSYIPDFIVRVSVKEHRQPGTAGSTSLSEGKENQSVAAGLRACRGHVSTDFLGEGRGAGKLNLIIEVTGEKKKDKEAKAATTRGLWVPAINNHGGFGRWAFVEVTDPWNAKSVIRAALAGLEG